MNLKLSFPFALLCFVLTLAYCRQNFKTEPTDNQYLNLQPGVKYSGMQSCRSCHNAIYETFINTGMGRSFNRATLEKTAATFGEHSLVFDETSNFYYLPYFKDSTIFVLEFRLEKGDTVHKRIEKISYIIGSGQHTNSHIVNFNGYVFQAPVTYYTQEGKWDMAPGFREGGNRRFSRFLTAECITCHNQFPKLIEGSLNKYEQMPRGIECERCHGPGEIHVREKLAGHLVDTSKFIDYSIVNPRKLPRDLQMDLCQRCHLQGVAVLEDGKTFFDFQPGMKLNQVMNVFLPRYANSHEKFIMASQADRLRMSECYKKSELSCLTCHNPHKSVKVTNKQQFNNACIRCHSNQPGILKPKPRQESAPLALVDVECSAPAASREAEKDNCVGCHMPRSGSIDIPHVNITDHFISRTNIRGKSPNGQEEEANFLGLKILTKERASPLEMAKGYIALFDKYVQAPIMLDSAKYYLDRSKLSLEKKFKTLIHYFFAKDDYKNILKNAPVVPPEKITDGWTAYRIGQAFYQFKDHENALKYYLIATKFLPYELDFQEKRGSALFALNRFDEARSVFEFVLKEDEKRPVALSNLGYLFVLKGEVEKGEAMYNKAIALDPDYEQALLNKAAVLLFKAKKEAARKLLKRVLKINPQNQQALVALQKF